MSKVVLGLGLVRKFKESIFFKYILNPVYQGFVILSIFGTVFVSWVVWDEYYTFNDVTGNWKVIDSIEFSEKKEYIGKTVEFNINLLQTGFDIKGSGEKVKYDGENEDYHSILSLDGKIKNKIIIMNFNESGKLRPSTGFFKIQISNSNDTLFGRFSSTAAETRGKTIFIRKSY